MKKTQAIPLAAALLGKHLKDEGVAYKSISFAAPEPRWLPGKGLKTLWTTVTTSLDRFVHPQSEQEQMIVDGKIVYRPGDGAPARALEKTREEIDEALHPKKLNHKLAVWVAEAGPRLFHWFERVIRVPAKKIMFLIRKDVEQLEAESLGRPVVGQDRKLTESYTFLLDNGLLERDALGTLTRTQFVARLQQVRNMHHKGASKHVGRLLRALDKDNPEYVGMRSLRATKYNTPQGKRRRAAQTPRPNTRKPEPGEVDRSVLNSALYLGKRAGGKVAGTLLPVTEEVTDHFQPVVLREDNVEEVYNVKVKDAANTIWGYRRSSLGFGVGSAPGLVGSGAPGCATASTLSAVAAVRSLGAGDMSSAKSATCTAAKHAVMAAVVSAPFVKGVLDGQNISQSMGRLLPHHVYIDAMMNGGLVKSAQGGKKVVSTSALGEVEKVEERSAGQTCPELGPK